jgi:hypothetical protein
MQKWEYQFVSGDTQGDIWYPRWVNGQELPNWKKGPTLYAYANQLGEQGWELVVARYTGGAGYGTVARLIFKRPKP